MRNVAIISVLKEREVDEVVLHDYDEKTNTYKFLCQTDDETYWVNDEDCLCEEKIKEYIFKKDLNIRTVYCFSRVSNVNQTRWSDTANLQKLNLLETAEMFKNRRIKIIEAVCSTFKKPCDDFIDILGLARKGDIVLVNTIENLSTNTNIIPFLQSAYENGVAIHSIEDEITFTDKTRGVFFNRMRQAHIASEKISERMRRNYEYKRKFM